MNFYKHKSERKNDINRIDFLHTRSCPPSPKAILEQEKRKVELEKKRKRKKLFKFVFFITLISTSYGLYYIHKTNSFYIFKCIINPSYAYEIFNQFMINWIKKW